MNRVSVRVDADLYRRLSRRAAGAELSLSDFVRAVLRQAAEPQAEYIFSSQDEILATCIQTLSIVATATAIQAPKALEQGMADARAILLERGLLGRESGR
jgi:RHH-type transcriptional regulator, rel operon repressor / antitoxin RelB